MGVGAKETVWKDFHPEARRPVCVSVGEPFPVDRNQIRSLSVAAISHLFYRWEPYYKVYVFYVS